MLALPADKQPSACAHDVLVSVVWQDALSVPNCGHACAVVVLHACHEHTWTCTCTCTCMSCLTLSQMLIVPDILHSSCAQERSAALRAFKEGDVRLLICTDVAARGIDISGLPFVVNMTLPDKSEDYIHRVGNRVWGGMGCMALMHVG